MPGFFEALENFKPTEIKKPTVKIQGKVFEVSIEKYKEIERVGAENYEIKKGAIKRKPEHIPGKTYEMLAKTEKGYALHEGNPYWPTEIVEGGVEWQIESE